ncbi:secreted RxLR effector protein 161-like [Rutidosis leptorrhynchoides]|uniref:secreted RxLR effector protein 161-like n=1 Tax=Rutidosis leptorrhynchoides TaxID=125765 RepID=UPI003A98F74C
MGEADVILGIRIKCESNVIIISQSHYVEKVLKKFNCFDCTSEIRRAKNIMDYSLSYTGFSSVIEGYSDARWITNVEDHSSTTDWVFMLGEGAISWLPRRKHVLLTQQWNLSVFALAGEGKEAEWL